MGLGNTGTVSIVSNPPPILLPLFCHPVPVAVLTKAACLNGFVLPVGCGINPALVCGLAPFPFDAAALIFLAKGFVPVCRGTIGEAAGGEKLLNWFCCSGGGEKGWDCGGFEPKLFADLAKGFVDCRSIGEATGVP